jgi:hypothetical protein
VDKAGGLFFIAALVGHSVGFLGIVALVGLYDTLRLAWPVMILAPILGAVGLTLMTISHVIPQATLAAPQTPSQ